MEINKVNIRPGVSILSVLKHLNYKPWYALAEFVDNAIDSYLKNEKRLKDTEGEDFKLKIEVSRNQTNRSIIIVDNAAGIHQQDFERAFRAAEIPPDNTGLSEFGMGMKSAACWFAQNWVVKSSALGEDVERIVTFDIKKIVDDKIEELNVENIATLKQKHGTSIELFNIKNFPEKRTIVKVKDHLTSIYRDFIRRGVVDLYLDGELLVFEEPETLRASHYKMPNGEEILWRRDLPEDFEIREGFVITKGFIAIRKEGSTEKAGLALFRRGRVIMGSADEGYRPNELFGNPNSFRYQRIFGELHIDGLQVSHTKDGFQGDEDMRLFLEVLQDELDDDTFPLLKQAEGYRVRATDKDYKKSAQAVVKDTVDKAKEQLTTVLKDIRDKQPEPEKEEYNLVEVPKDYSSHEEFEIVFRSVTWQISVELSWDNNFQNWIEIGDKFIKEHYKDNLHKKVRQIGIRLSLKHPFMLKFAGIDKSRIDPLLRMAVAIGLSEITARESGVKSAETIRRNLNELLKNALI